MQIRSEHFAEAEARAAIILEGADEDQRWHRLEAMISNASENNYQRLPGIERWRKPTAEEVADALNEHRREFQDEVADHLMEDMMAELTLEAVRDQVAPGIDRARWRKLGWNRARQHGGAVAQRFLHRVRLLRATGQ